MEYTLFCTFLILTLHFELTVTKQVDALKSPTLGTEELLLEISNKMNDPVLGLIGNAIKKLAETLVSREKDLEEMLVKKVKEELDIQVNETYEMLQIELVKLNESQQIILAVVCDMEKCTDWSEWSECMLFENQSEDRNKVRLGSQNRTRECGKPCESIFDGQEESQQKVCKVCPPDYVTTKHGFCIKLYQSSNKTWQETNNLCKEDEGHLVYVNNDLKSQDVTRFLESSKPGRVWMDGIQMTSGANWKFHIGSGNVLFTKWHEDNPNGKVFPNCMYFLDVAGWPWADWDCSAQHNYMCEIGIQ